MRHFTRLKFGLIFLLTLNISLYSLSADAVNHSKKFKHQQKWQAYTNLNFKGGNTRSIGRLDVFIPLKQTQNSLFFMDLRGMRDSVDNKEGNFGLGYRNINDKKTHIIGVYSFYDRRKSQTGSIYNQATFGAEFMTKNWDFRANGYIPEEIENFVGTTQGVEFYDIEIVGNNITYKEGVKNYETSLSGGDFEIGRRNLFLPNFHFYSGYYHFEGDNVEKINGTRFRAEYEVDDNLVFHGESTHDNVRGHDNFLGLSYRTFFGSKYRRKITGLDRRMLTPIIRDIDIITNQREEGSDEQQTLMDEMGNVQEIYYVDNSHSGSNEGTMENPFQTLAAAEAAAGPYDVIFVYSGDGTNNGLNTGFTMQTGQKLIGQYSGLSFNVNGLTLEAMPSYDDMSMCPKITDTGLTTGNSIIVGADNVTISGFDIALSDDTIGDGITFTNNSGFSVTNNTIHTGSKDADSSHKFENSAINISSNGTNSITGTISGNNISTATSLDNSNSKVGIEISADTNSTINLQVNANTISNNSSGIKTIILSSANAELSFKNNVIKDNRQYGISHSSSDSSNANIIIENNEMRGNAHQSSGLTLSTSSSIYIASSATTSSSQLNVSILNNTIDGLTTASVGNSPYAIYVNKFNAASKLNIGLQSNTFSNTNSSNEDIFINGSIPLTSFTESQNQFSSHHSNASDAIRKP